ncbi:GIY-YIG nuclease family protein [Parapedobacter sp. DT-150]|uniref:GIY-YIG nuclease family protein n=1 Tax=Parapedobacter sp. DT-150 TaxID=3396162 RepID=UPI003F1E0595
MSYYVYILTDCNRTCLHVGMTDDLSKAINTYMERMGSLLGVGTKGGRVVHKETLPSEQAALLRFRDVSRYTRMQKEKLIRKHNPNWVDVGSATRLSPPFLPAFCPFLKKLYTN